MRNVEPALVLSERNALRYSLVIVWLTTALVSVLELQGQSRALLVAVGLDAPHWQTALIVGGAAVDFIVGLMIWFAPRRTTYVLALCLMLGMTAAATVMTPSLWLHPLGPLSKNFPLAAMLWVLARHRP